MISRSETLWGGVLLLCWATAGLGGGTIAPARIPEDFPTDFPVYKNAVIKKYAPMVPLNPKLGNVLVLETPDSKALVLDFYRDELPLQGWKVEKAMANAPDCLRASKGERRISVSVLESQAAPKRVTIQLGVNGTP